MGHGILDTCCLINLCATKHTRAILDSLQQPIFIPESVKREALYLASPDRPGERDRVDVENLVLELQLDVVAPETEEEIELYVDLATELDDGEAMALALAKIRNLILLTDDRKAAKKAASMLVRSLTTPDVLHIWSRSVPAPIIAEAIQHIESRARYSPHATHPLHSWWQQCKSAL